MAGDDQSVLLLAKNEERRRALERTLHETADEGVVHAAAIPDELAGARARVAIVSLDVDEPLSVARRLVRASGATHLIFTGTDDERDAWRKPLLYEPLLPRYRRIVGLDGGTFASAVRAAFEAAAGHARRRQLVSRVSSEPSTMPTSTPSALTDALTRVVLDALNPPAPVRAGYAAVVEGALAGADVERSPEDFPRVLRRLLRRVEVLGGSAAREQVARAVAGLVEDERAARTSTLEVRDREDAERLVAAVKDAGRDAGLRSSTVEAFAAAVRDVVVLDVPDAAAGPVGVTVSVEAHRDGVTAAWRATTSTGARRITASVHEDEHGA